MSGRRRHLFAEGDLDASLQATQSELVRKVESTSEDYVLNVNVDEWVAHLVSEHSVDAPEIQIDQIAWDDQGTTRIDVSGNPMRDTRDRSGPLYVPGRRMVLCIPFSGEATVLQLRPSSFTMNPPIAEVHRNEIHHAVEYPSDSPRDLNEVSNQVLQSIQQYLGWAQAQIEAHNAGLEAAARGVIQRRRERLLRDHEHLAGLNIPIRRRSDAPTTYDAGAVRRRESPAGRPPVAASPPQPPDPTLPESVYEHVLELIRLAGHTMERSPDTFSGQKEEQLRDHLLVMLNSHYQGDVVGEAFNRRGKTDLLLRRDDQNLFIGECKFWGGVAAFTRALDGQLLAYATWRDTKLSLIVFVRQADFGQIIEKARAALEGHDAFRGWRPSPDETELRCKMRLAGDETREAYLSAQFFHLRLASSD